MDAPRKIRTLDRDLAPHEVAERLPIEVICDDLRSAYNVGAFFRAADACRVARLHLCGITAAPPNAKLEKTALGTTAYVPWTAHRSALECVRALRGSGVPVFGVEVTDRSRSLWEVEMPVPVALVFGHEIDGIGEAVLAECDGCVELPMAGVKNSLNVALAMGVVVYEVARQYAARGHDLARLVLARGWGDAE